MKLTVLVLSCLFYSFVLPAQHQLSGSIKSDKMQEMEFASVSLHLFSDSTTMRGVLTGANGDFLITEVLSGDYILKVRMLGYEEWRQALTIDASLVLEPIILRETSTDLTAVEVVSYRSVVESQLGKKVLRIGEDLASGGSTALEALDLLPSITTTPRGQVLVRGSSNVVIYINGKETRRDPSTLKFIASESLEKIELITNPSAKYDAEGVGGIINLVYKKNRTGAFKAELLTNLSLPTDPLDLNLAGGANVSWTRNKISLYANVSKDAGGFVDQIDAKRRNFRDSLQRYENKTIQTGTVDVTNALIGLTLTPDTATSIGLEVNFDRWDSFTDIEQRNLFAYSNGETRSVTLPNRRGETEDELWVSLSLKKSFSGERELGASLTAGGENEGNDTQSDPLDLMDLPSGVDRFLLMSDERESQRYYQAKLDYELPFFSWGKLQTGIKADLINYNIFQEVRLRSDIAPPPVNDFTMEMRKVGLYLQQQHRIKKLEYAIGLRLEQFDSDALQRTDEQRFTQRYVRLFPSVELSYLLADRDETIGLSYTRRINRPGFFDLNPYVTYEDPLNLETGNPALEPEIADLLEVNYHREWKLLSIDMTLFARSTSGAIQSIVSRLDDNRTIAIPVNIGQQVSRGIEAQAEYRSGRTLKFTGAFVLGQRTFRDNINEINFDRRSSWSIRLRQTINLKNNWKVEVSEDYRGPSFQIQEKTREIFYVNVGIAKKLPNSRGSVSVGFRDVFNGRQDLSTLVTSDFSVERRYKFRTRRIAVGVKYTIFDKK